MLSFRKGSRVTAGQASGTLAANGADPRRPTLRRATTPATDPGAFCTAATR